MRQSTFITRLLLVLLACCSVRSTVPKRHNRMASGSMETDEVKKSNLLSLLSGIFDWTSSESDEAAINSEETASPYRPQRSMYNTQAGKEKATCRNFFWKTFSTC